jgi:hypothetical protein
MQASAGDHIKDVSVSSQYPSFCLSPHEEGAVDEDCRVLIPAAELKAIFIAIYCCLLETDCFFEVYFLLVVGAQLGGVVLSPPKHSLLSEEDRVVVPRSNRDHLLVLEWSEDVRRASDALPPPNNARMQ